MKDIALTGADGFLGWHTKCAMAELGVSSKSFQVGQNFSDIQAAICLEDTSALIHIAGVNRGTDVEVHEGNIHFAEQVRSALLKSSAPPEKIVFANSIQSTNGSTYGNSKKAAATILENTASEIGVPFENIQIPNVYGEHGKPFYNAVTSTFCHQISQGLAPEINSNSALSLVHAQDVADCLLGKTTNSELIELSEQTDVESLLSRLLEISEIYSEGQIPDLSERFTRNLFNTYRSYRLPEKISIQLQRKSDDRGSFFEIIRSEGGQGQSSFSTTFPGVTRGDHFHRRKIERFTVLSGKATINIRKMFSDDVHSFEVNGNEPLAIDMPTMWTHNITNIGEDILYTSFWINEIFDPAAPDTIYEKVTR
jgi:UDP-2-acetamido-2,6-beta-L-arabino-hexul-4-ose reductase